MVSSTTEAVPGALLDGGFVQPVLGAQAAFDAIMKAFARPGTVAELGGLAAPPAPVPPAAGAFLAALADYDTPVWLDPAAAGGGMEAWLSFHTGAPLAEAPQAARFALLCDSAAGPAIEVFAQGTQAYPDRSVTMILRLEALEGGDALILRGPGIEREARITPRGLPRTFIEMWQENAARFPRGVDVLLAAGGQAVALPRTTRIVRA